VVLLLTVLLVVLAAMLPVLLLLLLLLLLLPPIVAAQQRATISILVLSLLEPTWQLPLESAAVAVEVERPLCQSPKYVP
jgi:hypothetical protein